MGAPGVRPYIGGQAVMEGVFMRSPRAVAVAVRHPEGRIVIKAEPYTPFYQRHSFLKWPFLRGAFVLVDSLVVGLRALNWSAAQASPEENAAPPPSVPKETPMARAPAEERKLTRGEQAALTGTLMVSFVLGLGLFVALPHLVTAGIGRFSGTPFDVQSAAFHVIDGVIKLVIFLGYLLLIRRHPDIRRVFAYHGAEHKTIYAYERELPLTVENVRLQSRFHPRCGTSFLIFVIGTSIVVFAAVFPLLPKIPVENALLRNLVQVLIKVPLMLPVAAISYEIIRLSSKLWRFAPARALAWPGLMLQRITTEEPDDRQLEVAITSLQAAFDAELALPGPALGLEGEVFPTGSALEA